MRARTLAFVLLASACHGAPAPGPEVSHQEAALLPTPELGAQPAVRLDDGRVLVLGSSTVLHDATGEGSRVVAAPPRPLRGGRAMTLADGRVLVLGGRTGSSSTCAPSAIYDPAHDHWTELAHRECPNEQWSVTPLLDGRVLIVGLYELAFVDVVANTRTQVRTAVNQPFHSATRLPDGRVLVLGGRSDFGKAVAAAFVVDPVTATRTDLAPLLLARHGHSATLLPDGRVLVAGGSSFEERPTHLVEIYDPASGRSQPGPPLASPRRLHGSLRLADGRIVLVGGEEPVSLPQGYRRSAVVEALDPSTFTWTRHAGLATPRVPRNLFELADGRLWVADEHFASERLELGRGTEVGPGPVRSQVAGFSRLSTTGTVPPPSAWIVPYQGGVAAVGAWSLGANHVTSFLRGRTWTQLPGATLPQYRGATVGVDEARGRLVYFGGEKRPNFLLDDVWELVGETWQPIAVPATGRPGVRKYATSVFDPSRGELLFFGGLGPQGARTDVWGWNGTRWREITRAPGGPLGVDHEGPFPAVYDAALGGIVLLQHVRTSEALKTWLFGADGSWRLLAEISSVPEPGRVRMTIDPETRRPVAHHAPSSGPQRLLELSTDGTSWSEQRIVEHEPFTTTSHNAFVFPMEQRLMRLVGSGFDLQTFARLPILGRPPAIAQISPYMNLEVDPFGTVRATFRATDDEGDPITYAVDALPAGATFEAATAAFSWTPGLEDGGAHQVTLIARDQDGEDRASLWVNVQRPITYGMFPEGVVDLQSEVLGLAHVSLSESGSSGVRRTVSTEPRGGFRYRCHFTGHNPGIVRYECQGLVHRDQISGPQYTRVYSVPSPLYTGVVDAWGTFYRREISGVVTAEPMGDYKWTLTAVIDEWRNSWSDRVVIKDLYSPVSAFLDRVPGH